MIMVQLLCTIDFGITGILENENLENNYQLRGAGIGLNLINSEDYDFGFYAWKENG